MKVVWKFCNKLPFTGFKVDNSPEEDQYDSGAIRKETNLKKMNPKQNAAKRMKDLEQKLKEVKVVKTKRGDKTFQETS